MVRKIVWSDKAFDDLRLLHDYIARDSKRYAQAQVKTVQLKVQSLNDYPLLGRLVPEFTDNIYREIIVDNYRVIYRTDDKLELIVIVAIIHCRQCMNRFQE